MLPLGHTAGDKLLMKTAEVLTRAAGRGDIVAHPKWARRIRRSFAKYHVRGSGTANYADKKRRGQGRGRFDQISFHLLWLQYKKQFGGKHGGHCQSSGRSNVPG